MGALRNHRQERFAQAVAKGHDASSAYAEAGYAPNDGNASRMNGNDRVRARVAELQERAAIRAEMTVADIVAQLAEDREAARRWKSPSAMVSATVAQAKVLGLVIDRQAHGGDPNAPPIATKLTVEFV